MKKKVNPLVISSVLYILATAIGQGMIFLGIIVFTRLMSKKDYGDYSTYYAYVSLLTVLIGANLYYALNNAYIDKAYRIKEFRKSVLVLSGCIAIPLTILLLLSSLFFKGASSWAFLMAAFHSYGFFLVNYRMYSANMENDYRKKLWLLILPNTLQFFLSLLLILLLPHFSFAARVAGSVAGVGLIGVIAFIEIIKCDGDLISLDDWRYALAISIPSIVMSLSYMLMQQCDKVMITKICGSEETAVYSVIYYLGFAMIAVNQAVSPVRQAWLYKRLNKHNLSGMKELQKSYLFVFAFLATAVMMFGKLAVKIIAPPAYWQFGYIVPFVVGASMMMLYTFYTDIILYYKKNTILSVAVLLSAVINVGLNALCIPKLGSIAACYTTVVSYLFLFFLTGIIAGRLIEDVYSKAYFSAFLVWIVIISLISFLTDDIEWFRYTFYGIALVVMIAYVIKNRSQFKKLVMK